MTSQLNFTDSNVEARLTLLIQNNNTETHAHKKYHRRVGFPQRKNSEFWWEYFFRHVTVNLSAQSQS